MGGAVSREPVSAGNFPDVRGFTGNFGSFARYREFVAGKASVYQLVSQQIPYSIEQGIYLPEQGIPGHDQGNDQQYLRNADSHLLLWQEVQNAERFRLTVHSSLRTFKAKTSASRPKQTSVTENSGNAKLPLRSDKIPKEIGPRTPPISAVVKNKPPARPSRS